MPARRAFNKHAYNNCKIKYQNITVRILGASILSYFSSPEIKTWFSYNTYFLSFGILWPEMHFPAVCSETLSFPVLKNSAGSSPNIYYTDWLCWIKIRCHSPLHIKGWNQSNVTLQTSSSSSILQPHRGCGKGHRKETLKIYDYEVSAVAMGTCRESEKRPERGSKPLGQKCTQYLAKDSYVFHLLLRWTSTVPHFCLTQILPRCCTIIARTKELASLASSSPMVQVIFSEKNCGKLYSIKSNANGCFKENVQFNWLGKNHKSLGVLEPHRHLSNLFVILQQAQHKRSLPSCLGSSICFLIRNVKVSQAKYVCQQILCDEQIEYFMGTFSWQICCQSWLPALKMLLWSNRNVIVLNSHTLDLSLFIKNYTCYGYLSCSHLLSATLLLYKLVLCCI